MQTEPSKAEPSKRTRRWFQFSLRTLLLLTLICAVAASWVAHRKDKKRGERETVAAIRKVGGLVYYDSEVEEKDLAGRIVNPAGPRGPEWVRELVGNDFFDDPMCVAFNNPIASQAIKARDSTEVTLPLVGELSELKWLFLDSSNVTDTGLESLKRLRRLRWLNLEDTDITDAGLPHLAELRKLEHLKLSGTKVTDAGLAHLVELKKLEFLTLDRTKITDAGLVNLEGLDSLQRLSVVDTNVTDAGLKHLRRLTKLDALWLGRTQVTKAGLKSLQESLPDCEIFWPQDEAWNRSSGAH